MQPLTIEQTKFIQTLARTVGDLALAIAHEPDAKVEAAIATLRAKMTPRLQETFPKPYVEEIMTIFERVVHLRVRQLRRPRVELRVAPDKIFIAPALARH
jgi:hypothetical protein